MKKLTLIVSALALLIGFSQCKKEEITPNSNSIQITLNANYGGNGSKTTFDPDNLENAFAWNPSETEYIEVGGSSSGYLGQLNNSAALGTGNFTGDITTPASGETLHFFYLGNGNHKEAYTLDFSNQSSGTVTNWHIAIGSAPYNSDPTYTYNVTLNMAMAIARFNLSGFGSENVYLNGENVYSTASINYNDGSISGNSKGYINLGTAGADKYVALIPSVETETTLNFNSGSKTGSMTFLRGIKPASYYSANGSALTVTAETGSGIPGTFTVSSEGKKVFFSPGNLQYSRKTTSDDWSTGVWSFMTNQYDVVETGDVSTNYEGQTAISLFGWATSGYKLRNSETNYYYKPYQTNSSNGSYYGPSGAYNIANEYPMGDWGFCNSDKIENGGGYNTWRILTKDEWNYIINERTASKINDVDNARFAKAKVGDVYGIIIFPDIYIHPNNVALPVGINDKSGNHWNNATSSNNNLYTTDNMISMGENGAVFLSCSGYRKDATLNYYNDGCYYWSSSNYSTTDAYRLSVSKYSVYTTESSAYTKRYMGCSVRLVRE